MRHPTLSEARSVARGEEFTDDSLRADLASARKLVAEMAAEVARLREVARSGWESARLLSIALGHSHATEERADRELTALFAEAKKGGT